MGELIEQLKTDLKHGQGRYSSAMGAFTLPFDYIGYGIADNVIIPAVEGYKYLKGLWTGTPETTETTYTTQTARPRPDQQYENLYIADINNWAMDNPSRVFGDDFVNLRLYLTGKTWEYLGQSINPQEADRYYRLGKLPSDIYSKFFNRSINEALHRFAENNVLPALELAAGEAVGTAGKELMYAASRATGVGRNYLAARAVRDALRGKPDFNMVATRSVRPSNRFSEFEDTWKSISKNLMSDDELVESMERLGLQVDDYDIISDCRANDFAYNPKSNILNNTVQLEALNANDWYLNRLKDGRLDDAIERLKQQIQAVDLDNNKFYNYRVDIHDKLNALDYIKTVKDAKYELEDLIALNLYDKRRNYIGAKNLAEAEGLNIRSDGNFPETIVLSSGNFQNSATPWIGIELSPQGYDVLMHEILHSLYGSNYSDYDFVSSIIQQHTDLLPGLHSVRNSKGMSNMSRSLSEKGINLTNKDALEYLLSPDEIRSNMIGAAYDAFKRGISFREFIHLNDNHVSLILQIYKEIFGEETLLKWDKMIIQDLQKQGKIQRDYLKDYMDIPYDNNLAYTA